MLRTVTLLFLFILPLQAKYLLKESYYYSDHTISARDLFPELKNDFTLFEIPEHDTRYRLKATLLSDSFTTHGVTIDTSEVRYVNFIKKSLIDTSAIAKKLAEYYQEHYPTLVIEKVTVSPRSYTPELPEAFDVIIAPKSYRRNNGTFHLKSPDYRRFFFDYEIKARITVIESARRIERKERLGNYNTRERTMLFYGFATPPLMQLDLNRYRSRHAIKSARIITQRSIEPLPIIQRNARVSVNYKNSDVVIEFSAKALQDGAKDDIISIQKDDGRRLKAKVLGPGRVEMR